MQQTFTDYYEDVCVELSRFGYEIRPEDEIFDADFASKNTPEQAAKKFLLKIGFVMLDDDNTSPVETAVKDAVDFLDFPDLPFTESEIDKHMEKQPKRFPENIAAIGDRSLYPNPGSRETVGELRTGVRFVYGNNDLKQNLREAVAHLINRAEKMKAGQPIGYDRQQYIGQAQYKLQEAAYYLSLAADL